MRDRMCFGRTGGFRRQRAASVPSVDLHATREVPSGEAPPHRSGNISSSVCGQPRPAGRQLYPVSANTGKSHGLSASYLLRSFGSRPRRAHQHVCSIGGWPARRCLPSRLSPSSRARPRPAGMHGRPARSCAAQRSRDVRSGGSFVVCCSEEPRRPFRRFFRRVLWWKEWRVRTRHMATVVWRSKDQRRERDSMGSERLAECEACMSLKWMESIFGTERGTTNLECDGLGWILLQ
jgi:hypothetical protein